MQINIKVFKIIVLSFWWGWSSMPIANQLAEFLKGTYLIYLWLTISFCYSSIPLIVGLIWKDGDS